MDKEISGAVSVVIEIGKAIHDLGKIPSGLLYAQVMDKMTLHQFNQVLRVLKDSGLVTETGNLLQWVEA